MNITEVRCPNDARRLFVKLRQEGKQFPTIVEGNLMEFACDECKKTLRRQGYQVDRVLHRYNLLGEFIETVVQPPA